MNFFKLFLSASAFLLATQIPTSSAADSGFVEGSKVFAITNLHADFGKARLYAMNYQVPRVIPVCSEFTIEDIGKKAIELNFEGADWDFIWDKHTRKAGMSLEENFKLFFAKSCDEASKKISKLSKVDQKGIKKGKPFVGMTKEGILFAMGRPPIHATPSLESSSWIYWTNKWLRDIIEFDDKGVVTKIVD